MALSCRAGAGRDTTVTRPGFSAAHTPSIFAAVSIFQPMRMARSGTLIPAHTISVTFVPRRSLNRSSRRMSNSVAYSRTSRESRAGSQASAHFGFRIRRREIGALSMMASAAV